ncbi:FIST N-terminal domain-containing protein [Stappia sp.]|uniref:FIST N-terminal domain-containing protein n=1 Tax=Stappia sp. TaxID=1870903 RepID=UPI0032D907B1
MRSTDGITDAGGATYACGVTHACGVAVLSTADPRDAGFWRAVAEARRRGDAGFALVFFSASRIAPDAVCAAMAEACAGLRYAACSTSGEVTREGLSEGNLVVVLFPADRFRVDALRLAGIRGAGMERMVREVGAAKRAFRPDAERVGDGRAFALCLIDGLSFAEEAVSAALHWALDDIPLLGGSAGDDMRFSATSLILDGEIATDCALVLLVETDIPFQVFKTDNFVPTPAKLVVTRSDPSRRVVHEFNAAPAAAEYARVIGMDPHALSPMSFASHPLVVRVGGEYYCRSVQKMNADGSLSFFCAIDDGIVMTVAEPAGMTRSTRDAFDAVDARLGGIDFVLGFDCVLRRIDARNRQVTHRISRIYRENNVVGFSTYGEQYLSMHLNQTFTGIAFGTGAANGAATGATVERRA